MPEQPNAHRKSALEMAQEPLKYMASAGSMSVADVQINLAVLQAANIQALVYVGDQIREQVEVQRQQLEQQRLANVIAAYSTTDDDGSLLDWDTRCAANQYVCARIGDIVNPAEAPDA